MSSDGDGEDVIIIRVDAGVYGIDDMSRTRQGRHLSGCRSQRLRLRLRLKLAAAKQLR
jgi:hypothetical protein